MTYNTTYYDFLKILDSYNINSTIFKGVRLFASIDLSLLKNHNRLDFSHFVSNNKKQLPAGIVKKLTGLEFKRFKEAYRRQNQEELTARGSINVSNWKGAIFYLYSSFDLSYIEQTYFGSESYSEFNEFNWKNGQVYNEKDPIINLRLRQLKLEKEQQKLYEEQLQLLQKQMSELNYNQS